MSSITYWNRVEPIPRSRSVAKALRAEVRDPVWMLTRQWQMGEFRGEDAASPAYVQFKASFSRIDRWAGRDGQLRDLEAGTPLEPLVQGDAFTPDLSTAIELGARFEAIAAAQSVPPADIQAFRTAYPIPTVAGASDEQKLDPEAMRFLAVCGGRGLNGAELLADAQSSAPAVPATVTPSAGAVAAVEAALAEFLAWIAGVYGEVGLDDGTGWDHERLEYRSRVVATAPSAERIALEGSPGIHGDFDWYAFDEVGSSDDREAASEDTEAISESVLPMGIRFPGLPKKRWWEFEDAQVNFGEVRPDKREVGKLLMLDFMLIHANDWFAVPLLQKVGQLCSIDQLLVHDVFGDTTLIRRAERTDASEWTMFSTTRRADGGIADYFILPPSAAAMSLHGLELESVRFFRDETANMVWCVEHTLESPVGRRQGGRERALAFEPEAVAPTTTSAALRYKLQTTVPANWIPFVPVQTDAGRRAVALERAAMRKTTPGGVIEVTPVGRILRPSALAEGEPYRIQEEEVTRSGLRVNRQVRCTRWTDGSTHIWVARSTRAGAGEGSSGLRFDDAESTAGEG